MLPSISRGCWNASTVALAFTLAACRSNPQTACPSTTTPPPVAIAVGDLVGPPAALRQGFLHGLNNANQFAAAAPVVSALAPKAWRLSNVANTYQFLAQTQLLGSMTIVVNLNDYYGNPVGVVGPSCGAGNPKCFATFDALLTDWSSFADGFMTSTATSMRIDVYDPFSEPDMSWHVTNDQMHQLFKAAHDAIRRHAPNAVISAPSISTYDPVALDSLMAYCAANGLILDALSWHEFAMPQDVPDHVAAMRGRAATYPSAAVRQIHINEYGPPSTPLGGPDSHLLPGWAVAWLAAFEVSSVDEASRACWDEAPNWTDCIDGLDGLLMQDDTTPQPAYWVYRAYAQLGTSRVATTSSDPGVAVIASRDDAAHTVQAIIGRAMCSGATCGGCFPGPSIEIDVTAAFPYASSAVQADVIALPGSSGPTAFASPVPESAAVTSVDAGHVAVTIANARNGDAYLIRFH